MSETKFEPANLLEIALMKAATDPAARPLFLRELLDSSIVISSVGPKPSVVNGVIPADTKISMATLEYNGRQWLPFFSSEKRLPAGTEYLQFSARTLFEMTRGASLVLNPGLPYGKEFYPEEVSGLLDGSAFTPREQYVVQEDTQVLIGQPADYPKELVAALTRLYAGRPEVKRAWIAFYHNPERDKEGGLLIAIDVPDQARMEFISGETGLVINSLPKRHNFVDVVRYDGTGVTEYFSRQKPFHSRGVFQKLKQLISG